MRLLAERLRAKGRIGFVPTMGYLHEGHLSLVRIAKKRADFTVVSVFVNPTQFGPDEDLTRYPRDLGRDLRLLKKEMVDVVFAPKAQDMYPEGYATYVEVEGMTRGLCGRHRPGHFRGVLTVVGKLLGIVRPHLAVFGQKDAQQALVIRRMVRDLNFGTRIVIGPTAREPDGLAMSSRNAYLSPKEREEAPILHQALRRCRFLVRQGERSPARLRRTMSEMIGSNSGARVQYIEFVDLERLEPVAQVKGKVLVAIAAVLGRTRLIDNAVLRA